MSGKDTASKNTDKQRPQRDTRRAAHANPDANTKDGEAADATANDLKPCTQRDLLILTTELTDKVTAVIDKGMAQFSTKLDAIAARIENEARRLDEAEQRISNTEDSMAELEAKIVSAEEKLAGLTSRLDDQEARSRRDNIKIFNLKEGAEGHNAVAFFETWLPRLLNMEVPNGRVVLDRCHRSLGRPKSANIVLMQETHLTDSKHEKLRRDWVGQIYYSSFSSMKDDQGRYVLITGYLYGEHIFIGCVYAPNVYQKEFYSDLLGKITNLSLPFSILGGDFNCTLNPEVNQFPSAKTTQSKMRETTIQLCADLQLLDTWRTINPTEKDYTFFSNPHCSHSRIDYFFSTRGVLDRVEECKIGTRLLSDHAEVSMIVSPCSPQFTSRSWRLNPSLLCQSSFISFLNEQIKDFLLNNDNDETNASILWDTLKAYLRGAIISYSTARKREALKAQFELEAQLKSLERQLKLHPSVMLKKELEATRSSLVQLLTQKAEASILYAKQRFFAMGDKSGRLLARLVTGRQHLKPISTLQDDKGKNCYETKKIVEIMKQFYSKLYTSENKASDVQILEFLSNIKLPSLSDADQLSLNKPISKEEILAAIESLSSGKAPGPDGYNVEFYKSFKDSLTPLLLRMYLHSVERGCLPQTLYSANISLYLKKDKPPDNSSSYRPISLINVDSKILSKILTPCTNMKTLLNLIQHTKCNNLKGIIISLDAEKAFDRVEWPYLFLTLQKFGLGTNFVGLVKLLYHSPKASVLVNGVKPSEFSLGRSTRQGDPISPLIFALAVEPLAEAIRSHNSIKGLKMNNKTFKIALYADDILLFVSDPEVSIPKLMTTIKNFSIFSGYKINFSKSVALPLGYGKDPPSLIDFPFSWSISGFSYLGISISSCIDTILKSNFQDVFKKIQNDLIRWTDLPISWIGRINLLKMNVFPRILFPLQMLPIYLSKKRVSEIEKVFSTFIWKGKTPRLKRALLKLPKERGGLTFPDIRMYNWACHGRIIREWIQSYLNGEDDPSESWSCTPYNLLGEVTAPKIAPDLRRNPIVYNLMKSWRDMYKLGVRTVKDIFSKEGTLMSFTQLKEAYGLPNNAFFAYLQVRHCICSHVRIQTVNWPLLNPNESFMTTFKLSQGFISHCYGVLQKYTKDSVDGIFRKWEEDLGVSYNENDWLKSIRDIHTVFISNTLREMQFKIFHRQHRTPYILNKIDPARSSSCLKCKQSPATYLHCFWLCPRIFKFWVCLSQEMSAILRCRLCLDPGQFLLGLPTKNLYPHPELFKKLLALARKCILKKWIMDKPPTVTDWYNEIFKIMPKERIGARLAGKYDLFTDVWQPFIDYLPGNVKETVLKGSGTVA
uniref:Reverse transcriptase domain-containing protein n=1 Tax=Salarias fasciatus TaxID=181472 RepID=A0A672FWV9_SALFA